MRERLLRLLSVKSIVTIALTTAYCYLAVTGRITGREFLTIFTMVISFYFGTQRADREVRTHWYIWWSRGGFICCSVLRRYAGSLPAPQRPGSSAQPL